MPSVSFVYDRNGEVIREMGPLTSPVVEAFMNGEIGAEEYFRLRAEEDLANQKLRDFMYGDQPPDFMPKIQRALSWRGWLRDAIGYFGISY